MEQQKHYHCIQDPEGIQLYTLTGHITKGAFITHLLLCQGFHFFGEFPSSFRAYDTWHVGAELRCNNWARARIKTGNDLRRANLPSNNNVNIGI